jgi:hypothetical protein
LPLQRACRSVLSSAPRKRPASRPSEASSTPEISADRWITEARDGIDGTSIRPASLKIGIDGAPLLEGNGNLVQAVALTHKADGSQVRPLLYE